MENPFSPQKSDALLVSRKIDRNNNTNFLFQGHDIKILNNTAT